eukprot:TRINITY_DN12092_c0_g1_i2.p1 TRINITY_DN12092_c0_g1~~TRINITY_DN12092_c0_g1_i2.p1  ORF type:complete len:117 (-),score=27.43 TRINITY_DN12092_c0_g1_i2:76-426(-)
MCIRDSFSRKKALLTAWSSGTGFAGVFGYGWVCLLHDLVGMSFSTIILVSVIWGIVFLVICDRILARPAGVGWYERWPMPELEHSSETVSYTHLRAHETPEHLVCRLLLEKKKYKI